MHPSHIATAAGRFVLFLARVASRATATALGAWLAAILPMELHAEHRRAINSANGHLPNMDPGTMVALAALIAAIIVAVVLVGEIVRCYVMEKKPLSLPSHVAVGAITCLPIPMEFTGVPFRFDQPMTFVLPLVGILSFYGIRGLWLRRQGQRQK